MITDHKCKPALESTWACNRSSMWSMVKTHNSRHVCGSIITLLIFSQLFSHHMISSPPLTLNSTRAWLPRNLSITVIFFIIKIVLFLIGACKAHTWNAPYCSLYCKCATFTMHHHLKHHCLHLQLTTHLWVSTSEGYQSSGQVTAVHKLCWFINSVGS